MGGAGLSCPQKQKHMAIHLRNIPDAALQKVTALPAAGASNSSAAIQLGDGLPDDFVIQVSIPATPNLANGQTLTFAVQDSADGATFSTITGLSSVVVTGTAGGGPATVRSMYLPPTVRQYIALNQTASSSAGNNTAVSSTLSLLF